jgi:hypothetical protein
MELGVIGRWGGFLEMGFFFGDCREVGEFYGYVWDREMCGFLWRWEGCGRWVDCKEMGEFYGDVWVREMGGFYGDGWDAGDGWILWRWVVFMELDGCVG